MTYAIGYIVYGVSFNDAPLSLREDIEYLRDCDFATTHYSGSGEGPIYIGETKGEIDECRDIELSELLKYKVNDKDKATFESQKKTLLDLPVYNPEKISREFEDSEPEGVTQDFKDWLAKGEPTLFITWGSS
jgi:hypothetical protein